MSISTRPTRSTLFARSTGSYRSCLSTVSALSDRELLSRVQTLTRTERDTTLVILLHLNEVFRRRLHLSLGYRSLFDYCVRHLNYSRSAAGRRFQTARCIREFPEVYRMLERGEVSLSTITLAASVLTEANKDELLGRICGKSQQEVEAIVAGYKPPVSLRDQVKPVCVRVPATAAETGAEAGVGAEGTSEPGTSSANPSRYGTNCAAVDGGGPVATGSEMSRNSMGDGHPGNGTEVPRTPSDTAGSSDADKVIPRTRIEQKLLIRFVASKALMKKYNEVCALLSNTVGKTSFETVFEAVLDDYIERHSPRKRVERRKKRTDTAKRNGSTNPAKRPLTDKAGGNGSKPPVKTTRTNKPGHSRHIPAAVRDKVFIRDQGKCTYVGRTGRRCGSTRGLHIDHVVPYARGGTNAASNLRLLCSKHNRLEAERLLGAGITHRFRRQE